MPPRKPITPQHWTDSELDTERQKALDNFIGWRGTESSKAYTSALENNAILVRKLLESSNDLRSLDPNLLQGEPSLVTVARYLLGPPISADDLATLVGGRPGKRALKEETARRIIAVIRAAWDPIRFPWIAQGRDATQHERESAILWTAGVWAAEQLRTLWRNEPSRRQQDAVLKTLVESGFKEQPRVRSIQTIDQVERGNFMREAPLAGRKCDVPVRLRDGRLLALECKVSNSATNSVKRLIGDTGGKASHWDNKFGKQVVTGAVLAGVYKLINLKDAQDNYGVWVFWEHNLQPLKDFVSKSGA